ncbi:MAG: hypothetical protein U1E14_17890 [Geminicoccaceae bacterium]
MATVTIRDLDDDLVARVMARARAHRRPFEAEVAAILSRAVRPLAADEVFRLADALAARREPRSPDGGGLPPRDGREA